MTKIMTKAQTPPAHLNELGDNLDAATQALAGEDERIERVVTVPKARAAAKPKEDAEERVTIILQDNSQIPPSGQFIGVNGKGYLIQAGVEVSVPVSVLEVLDNAIESHPVVDRNDTVLSYRNRLRFPYSIVNIRRRAGAQAGS